MNYINENELLLGLNNDRIFGKWRPIMDALRVEEDSCRELFSLYAESYHINHPITHSTDHWNPIKEKVDIKEKSKPKISVEEFEKRLKIDPFGEENWEPVTESTFKKKNVRYENCGTADMHPLNYLPLNLKILSKLDLTNKNVVLTTNPELIQTILFTLTREQVESFRFAGLDVVARVESIIMKNIEDYINEKLKEYDTFYLNDVVYSTSNTIVEGTFFPVTTFHSMIGFV